MTIRIEELNEANCKTYLLTSGRHAALVDPIRERVESLWQLLKDRSLTLDYIFETHTHADHMMLGRKEKDRLSAPLVMHTTSPSPIVDRHVTDGDTLPLGTGEIRVLHTPGHTPDSTSYLVGGAVLTGDTLLIGGSGRTDFAGGDPGASFDSITKKLFTLSDDTLVFPAHDYRGNSASTIGKEKTTNPRLAGKSRMEYVAIMNALDLPLPERIRDVLQVNQSGFELGELGEMPSIGDLQDIPEIAAPVLARELDSLLILDVREPEEFVGPLGHIEGALLIPMDALARRLPKLAGYVDREIVTVCRAGVRSRTALAILRKAGFRRVRSLAGGMLSWRQAKLSIQR